MKAQARKASMGVSSEKCTIRPCLYLVNRDKENAPVCTKVDIASNAYHKAVGLLRRSGMEDDECLVIPQCSSIHTHFMRFRIDVIFVDETWRVLRVAPSMAPWRCAFQKGASHVIEMTAGHAAKNGIQEGTQLGLAIVPISHMEENISMRERG